MKRLLAFLALWLAIASMLSAQPAAAGVKAGGPLESYIAVVWPHNGQGAPTSVTSSRAVNVSAWPSGQAVCAAPNTNVALWMARNAEPAVPVRRQGTVAQRTYGGITFSSIEYNDVPANIADNPGAQYRFFLLPDPGAAPSNIWVHAGDARTFYPNPLRPTGYSSPGWTALDTRIQIVFPHDAAGLLAPVESAPLLNIAVDVFAHQTQQSLPPDYDITPTLWMAAGNQAPSALGGAAKTTYMLDGRLYPRWVFNNVAVNPALQYHFLASVPGLEVYPNIWTHARDARTFMPSPTPPAACACAGGLTAREEQLRTLVPSVGCPLAVESELPLARQFFQRGQMLWRSDTKTIYVVETRWRSYPDLWRDGDPAADPNLTPPPGFFQPVRGFGRVWRDQLGGANASIGWATGQERGLTGGVRPWQGGLVFRLDEELLILFNDGTARSIR